jgi:hypothetical protein
METKESNPGFNPKDACGIKKVPFSTVSMPVMAEVGLAMLEGALKYGRHNYRVVGVRASVYFDALMRHMGAWWEGEDIDPDSGLSHVTKAIATLVVLRDSMIRNKLCDDRPPKCYPGWVNALNTRAAGLVEKFPKPMPAHLATDESETPSAEIPCHWCGAVGDEEHGCGAQ